MNEPRPKRNWYLIGGLIAIVVGVVPYWIFLRPRFEAGVYDMVGYRPHRNASDCMLPNMARGLEVFVDQRVFRSRGPVAGEVVAFRWPADGEKVSFQRVVAVGGSCVSMQDGQLFVDGAPVAEHYLPKVPLGPDPGDSFAELTVPRGSYFLLGDNRGACEDSRALRVLPRERIVGLALL